MTPTFERKVGFPDEDFLGLDIDLMEDPDIIDQKIIMRNASLLDRSHFMHQDPLLSPKQNFDKKIYDWVQSLGDECEVVPEEYLTTWKTSDIDKGVIGNLDTINEKDLHEQKILTDSALDQIGVAIEPSTVFGEKSTTKMKQGRFIKIEQPIKIDQPCLKRGRKRIYDDTGTPLVKSDSSKRKKPKTQKRTQALEQIYPHNNNTPLLIDTGPPPLIPLEGRVSFVREVQPPEPLYVERYSEPQVQHHVEPQVQHHVEPHVERHVEPHFERHVEPHFERHFDPHVERRSEPYLEPYVESHSSTSTSPRSWQDLYNECFDETDTSMTPEELEEYRASKRERNKLAARRCRQKQRDRTDRLEKVIDDINYDNQRIEDEIAMLRMEVEHLTTILTNHHCVMKR